MSEGKKGKGRTGTVQTFREGDKHLYKRQEIKNAPSMNRRG